MPTRTRDVVMATAESDADTDTDTDVELVHGERIYRRFTFGNLAALQMLENRLVNRSLTSPRPAPRNVSPSHRISPAPKLTRRIYP
jgi:hypothetical protein